MGYYNDSINMGSNRGWVSAETVAACRAFLSASQDPRRGTGKKKDLLVKKCHKRYVELMNGIKSTNKDVNYPDRSGEAVIQRYKKAKAECIKFDSIVSQIKSRSPTGSPTDEDIDRAALAIYNEEATISQSYTYLSNRTQDVGDHFPFADALKLFRDTYAWEMCIESKASHQKYRATLLNDKASSASEDMDQRTVPSNKESSDYIAPESSDLMSIINQPNQTDVANIPSADPNESNHVEPTKKSEETPSKSRPIGNKRSLEMMKQCAAL